MKITLKVDFMKINLTLALIAFFQIVAKGARSFAPPPGKIVFRAWGADHLERIHQSETILDQKCISTMYI